jgi:hypothetical protein
MGDAYAHIASYLDEYRLEDAPVLLDEVDPSEEELDEQGRNDIKLTYPETKSLFEEAQSLRALWLERPWRASYVVPIFENSVELVKYSLDILGAFQQLHYYQRDLCNMRIVGDTIIMVTLLISRKIKQWIENDPWIAEYFEDIISSVIKPISNAQIDLKLIYEEDLPENIHDADDTCSICKDLLRNNTEDESSEFKPQTIQCRICKNIFHNQCMVCWKNAGPGENFSVDCPLCNSMADPTEIFHRKVIDDMETVAHLWS